MSHFQPFSYPVAAPSRCGTFAAILGGLMCNVCLSMVILWLGCTVATGVMDVTKSSWYYRGVQRFETALEETLDDAGVSTLLGLDPPAPVFTKDPARIQMEETRARRKLAKELRQRKPSHGGSRVVWHQGRKT